VLREACDFWSDHPEVNSGWSSVHIDVNSYDHRQRFGRWCGQGWLRLRGAVRIGRERAYTLRTSVCIPMPTFEPTPFHWNLPAEAPPLDERFGTALSRSLAIRMRSHHLENASKPIEGPNKDGAFPNSELTSVPPIVADTDDLQRDLVRACRNDERTILINAANSKSIRIFCAEHVLDEVERQEDECADRANVPVSAIRARWERDYLPLLRLVDVRNVFLDPNEAERIALLDDGPDHLRDSSDVPTAILALQLGAFVLSTDKKVLWAVYGQDADLHRHDAWVSVLRGAGDAAYLEELNHSTEVAMAMATMGAFEGLKWIWQNISPLAVGLLAAGAGYATYRASPETRKSALKFGSSMIEGVMDLKSWYDSTLAAFLGVAPDIPSWDELARVNSPDNVLGRACIHALARGSVSYQSAAELARSLPILHVPRGEAKVRSMLRSCDSFVKVYNGYWQMGRPSGLAEIAALP
jgi:hypothetical protein